MELLWNELFKFFTDQPLFKLVLIYVVYKITRIDSKVDRHRRDWQSESKTMRHFFVPDSIKPEFDRMITATKVELESNYKDVKDFLVSSLVFLKALMHFK